MGNITTEQKLQLVQQIRAEHQDNRMTMRNRERMLYGTERQAGNCSYEEKLPLYSRGYYDERSLKPAKELSAMEEGCGQTTTGGSPGFKLRLILAAFLFGTFLMIDTGSGAIAGISTETLLEEMNRDFDTGLEQVVFDFEDNFPYTLFKK